MKRETFKVLFVEDNPDDAELLMEALRSEGSAHIAVVHLSRLREALEQLKGEDFDIVLLDLGLPDSEGLDTLHHVLANAPDQPVVVLTGLDDEQVGISAVRAGAQDYLVKGKVNGSLLERSLRYAIERKRARDALRVKDRAIESSINPIAIADLESNLTYVNHSFLELWGYESDKVVLQRPAAEFWHMHTDGLQVAQVLRNRRSWTGRICGRRKDGSTLDLQLSASLVEHELGKPLCMVFSFVDMTELSALRRRLKTEQSFAGIVGRDPKMLELFDTIREVAEIGAPVLIQGESGTGKELVAAAIHNEGPRSNKFFVPVNCSALPEGLLESELFGHVRGAFTGAIRDKKGRFELADGGTIFLDEIGDLSPATQVKLLRVLQDGTFERVGSEKSVNVDVRVISATNKNLRREMAAKRFREDLFYRLCVIPVNLPPLRERRMDIPLLAEHILKHTLAQAGRGREDMALSQEVLDVMLDCDWPGNVRELQNAIQYALVKCRGNVIEVAHLPSTVSGQPPRPATHARSPRKTKLREDTVRRALQETNGNKAEAARRLGVGRATLYRFLNETGMLNKFKDA